MLMITLDTNTRNVGSSIYSGERGDWFIALAIHRDSDPLSRSNFECMQKALNALPAVKEWAGEDSPVQIERFSHWAVGWCDYLLINPECKEALELANRLEEKLDDYPVLNEDHWSELETSAANDVWRDCYNAKGRVSYVRKHRGQFEFRDFADMLSCLRGRYFSGYPGELLS